MLHRILLSLRIVQESVGIALHEIVSNRVRSSLSLMGISIGIFCVVAVVAVIDSFEDGLKKSFERLGNNVLYVMRESWKEDPGMNWWKYLKRPNPTYAEFKAIKEKVKSADKVAIRAFIGQKDLKYHTATVEKAICIGVSHDFGSIYDLQIESGRYFMPEESHKGANVVILGNKLAELLFPSGNYPVGKSIKLLGRDLTLIGVLKKEGKSILGDGFDEVAITTFNYARNLVDINSRRFYPIIAVKARDDVSLELLQDDLRQTLRAERHLQPKEADNFELNQLSILTQFLDKIFAVVGVAGALIGGFAILVGGFGIANIMFVSVKERTRLIGIKKSLGARGIYILLEFLTESVLLTLLGGLVGLVLVYIVLQIGNYYVDSLEFVLSRSNITLGILISVIVGIISGFIPAYQASKLDPVVAMRG